MMRYLGVLGAAAAALALLAGCSDDPLRPAGEGGAAPDDAARARAYAEAYCDHRAICAEYFFPFEDGTHTVGRRDPIPAAEIETCKRTQARQVEQLLTCGEPRLAEYARLGTCTDVYARRDCPTEAEAEACAEALNKGETCALFDRLEPCGVLGTFGDRCGSGATASGAGGSSP